MKLKVHNSYVQNKFNENNKIIFEKVNNNEGFVLKRLFYNKIIKKQGLDLPIISRNIMNNYRYRNFQTDNNQSLNNSSANNSISIRNIKVISSSQMTPNKKIEKPQVQLQNKPTNFSKVKIQNRLKQFLDIKEIKNINQEKPVLNYLSSLSIEASYINLNRRQNSANKINKDDSLNNLYLRRLNSFRMEKENLEKMRIKYMSIQKEKEEKQKDLLKQKRLEFKQQLETERQKIEESKKIKAQEEEKKKKEEEERNNALIQEAISKSNEEKELDLKESSLVDDASKHEYRLSLLNKYIKQYLEMDREKDVIIVLELIHKIGQLLKREIHYDKEKSQDNILSITQAVKSDDTVIHFLGVLGEEFKNYGINSIVEKKSQDPVLMEGLLKVLFCEYSLSQKYNIKVKTLPLITKFLKNTKAYLNFVNNFKKKISEDYSIQDSKIFIISNRTDLCEFNIVILNREEINVKRYESTHNIIVKKRSLLGHVKLSPDFFEKEFNREKNSWSKKNLKRGGEKYIPPFGWKGFALKVLNKYDNFDNIWLGNEGKEGEWAIAYHGIGKGEEFKKLMSIILNNLRKGPGQLYKNLPNIRDNNKSLIGNGIYLSPNINEAERYAEKIHLGKRKSNFQFIIMCRVNPDKIREPGRIPINWIVDDDYDCIRPYRILVKETNRKSSKSPNK